MNDLDEQDVMRLKRIGRYLKGWPSLDQAMKFTWRPNIIRVQTDSEWAGREEKRKSVSGGSIRVGGQWVRSWPKGQSKVAGSSGEAELHAANYGSSQAMCLKSIVKELGWDMAINFEVGANATIGILHRRGLGKLRHVEMEELWLQQEEDAGKVVVRMVPGTRNTADTGTKAVNK